MSKPRNSKSKYSVESLTQSLDELVAQRETWENGDYTNSNQSLYALLGACLNLFAAAKDEPKLKSGLKSYMKDRGLTITDSTSLQLRIVRAVFAPHNATGKLEARLMSYAKVIKVAADDNQTGNTLPAYIRNQNGIEAIRRSKSNGTSARQSMPPQQARKFAVDTLSATSTKKLFKSFQLHVDLQPNSDLGFSVAIVSANRDGTGCVLYGTNHPTAVNSILAFAGRQLAKAAGQTDEEQKTASTRKEEQAGVEAFNLAMASAKAKPAVPVT